MAGLGQSRAGLGLWGLLPLFSPGHLEGVVVPVISPLLAVLGAGA